MAIARILGLASLCWLLLSGFTIRPTGGDFVVAYTEPVISANGSSLTDLDHCNVITIVGSQCMTTSPDIPASALTGGGNQVPVITIYWGPVPSQAIPLDFSVTCTDGTGNQSIPSASVLFAVDPYPLLVP